MSAHGANWSVPPEPEWLDLRALQAYAAVSNRTLREWIRRSSNPLPASQVGRKLLVRRRDFDRWIQAHRIQPVDRVGRVVNEVVSELIG
jgi:excisionase family DNA binding protein